MIHPAAVFAIGLLVLFLVMWRWRLALPLGLVITSVVIAALGGSGFPFRHLVEGGFGYLNLVLALFAGSFFSQSMRLSGAADAFAGRMVSALGARPWLVLLVSGALLFLVGMLVGIAGVAVLAAGVFVVPMLRSIGMPSERIAAYIAVLATCGMIAPPVNVPAMSIADGVNMPFAGFMWPLLLLSIVPAILTLVAFSLGHKKTAAVPAAAQPAAPAAPAAVVAFAGLTVTLGFWIVLRLFPTAIPDPAVPLVLVIGGVTAVPLLGRKGSGEAITTSFTGVPLLLAAVLIGVGVGVQIMTLTGVRGWLVITSMSFPAALTYLELLMLPLFGGVLSSMGSANVIGVPFAFAFIHQDMILNVASLSALAAISEFMPPTAIATALSLYIVGDTTMLRTLRHCVLPVAIIAAVAVTMLVFADQISPLISGAAAIPRH